MLRSSLFALALLGCGVSGGQLHAEILRGGHGFVQEWEEFTETGCPAFIAAATTVDEVDFRESKCLKSAEGQHIAAEIIPLWAIAALDATEKGKFELQRLLPYIRQLVRIWKESYDVLGERGMPRLPDAILRLAGIGTDE